MMSVLKSAKCSKHYLHQQPPSCQRYVQQQVAFPHSPFADQATCTVQMCLHHHLVQPGGVTAPATPMMIQKRKEVYEHVRHLLSQCGNCNQCKPNFFHVITFFIERAPHNRCWKA